MDDIPGGEMKCFCQCANMHGLGLATHQVALGCAGNRIVKLPVLPRIYLEIGIQLAVDSVQEVEIECRCNALRIIIGIENGLRVFCKIEADQKLVARPRPPPPPPRRRRLSRGLPPHRRRERWFCPRCGV